MNDAISQSTEIAFGSSPFDLDPVWTDVTQWVLGGGNGDIQITRGRPDQFGEVQPGRMRCTLRNDDGRFTPGLSSSPYWPNVKIRKRVRHTTRVRQGVNFVENPSFEQGTLGWEAIGSAAPAVALSAEHVLDGGQAVRLTWQTDAGTLNGYARTVHGFVIGATYTASVHVWVPAGSPDMQVVVSGFGFGTATSTKDAWVRVSHTWVADSTSQFLGVVAAGAQTAGQQCWVDAAQVEGGAAASTFDPRPPTVSRRFDGHITGWPTVWVSGAGIAHTTLTAVDRLQPIKRRGTLASFLIEESRLDSPLAYAPLSDPDGATTVSNIAGAGTELGTVVNIGGGGTAAFGQGVGPPGDGSAALVLTPASASSGYYVDIPVRFFNFTSAGYGFTVEAWVNSSTVSRNITSLVGGGRTSSTMNFDGTGKLSVAADAGGLSALSPGVVANGATHHVAYTVVVNGVDHVLRVYLDGVQVATTSQANTDTLAGYDAFRIGSDGAGNLYAGTIAHCAFYTTGLSAARINAHYHAGWDGSGGERSDQRVSRLAAYIGLTSQTAANRTGVWVLGDTVNSVLGSTTVLGGSDLNLDTGAAAVYGQSTGGIEPVSGLQDVARTENGIALIDREALLRFRNRSHRYNQRNAFVLDASATPTEVHLGARITTDDTLFVNDITARTEDGVERRAANVASQADYGIEHQDLTLLTRDTGDALSAANWRVSRYGEPTPQISGLTVELHGLPADRLGPILDAEVSTQIGVTGLPPQAPTPSMDLFVEGYTETIKIATQHIEFTTSSAAGHQVWVLGDPELSVLGTSTVLAY